MFFKSLEKILVGTFIVYSVNFTTPYFYLLGQDTHPIVQHEIQNNLSSDQANGTGPKKKKESSLDRLRNNPTFDYWLIDSMEDAKNEIGGYESVLTTLITGLGADKFKWESLEASTKLNERLEAKTRAYSADKFEFFKEQAEILLIMLGSYNSRSKLSESGIIAILERYKLAIDAIKKRDIGAFRIATGEKTDEGFARRFFEFKP